MTIVPFPVRNDRSDVETSELAARARGGDRLAFEEIYRRHVGRIYALGLRLTADATAAETLTQDAFVKAWFALDRFDGRGSFAGWLVRLTINLWRDQLRADKRTARLLERLAVEENHHGQVDDVRSVLAGVDLERCVVRLPRGARTVFVLHEIEGFTHREIAQLLAVAEGTVKAHLHRARRLLRGMLKPDAEVAHGA